MNPSANVSEAPRASLRTNDSIPCQDQRDARGRNAATALGDRREIKLLIHEIEWSVFSLIANPTEMFADKPEKHSSVAVMAGPRTSTRGCWAIEWRGGGAAY